MKNNTVYKNTAVLGTILNNYTMDELSDGFIQIMKDNNIEITIQEIKSDGCVFRHKREFTASNNDIYKYIEKLITNFMYKNEVLIGYLSDHYEVNYDESNMDYETMKKVIDVRLEGRLIYIEFDL